MSVRRTFKVVAAFTLAYGTFHVSRLNLLWLAQNSGLFYVEVTDDNSFLFASKAVS
jgi:hypothetical protein